MMICRKVYAFTLVELLATAAILAYSLSVILATYVGCFALNAASRNLTAATSHAEFVLEDIRNTAFSSVGASITGGTWNWNTAAVTSNGLNALNGESIAVTYTGNTIYNVQVTVSWKDLNNRARSRSWYTFLTS